MANPQFIEQKPLSLAEVKEHLVKIESRDKELNFMANKTKEYLDNFAKLSLKQKEELAKKLAGLNLTRLKEEHINKIADFLPRDANELKVVLQAYPLSMPKKDQDAIAQAVAEFIS